MLPTTYRSDAFQEAYVIIDSFDDLLRQVLEADLASLWDEMEGLPDLDPAFELEEV